jgi:hypothetical protein
MICGLMDIGQLIRHKVRKWKKWIIIITITINILLCKELFEKFEFRSLSRFEPHCLAMGLQDNFKSSQYIEPKQYSNIGNLPEPDNKF